jgi:8-oxo-dGTP diphosphatase
MEKIGNGVKGIVRKDDRILILVKPDGTFDLPGGRVEKGETTRSALRREIDEETGLKVEIKEPIEEWSFVKRPNLLIKGITFACSYLEGKVKLCEEHKNYFWAEIDNIHQLKFSREILRDFHYAQPALNL